MNEWLDFNVKSIEETANSGKKIASITAALELFETDQGIKEGKSRENFQLEAVSKYTKLLRMAERQLAINNNNADESTPLVGNQKNENLIKELKNRLKALELYEVADNLCRNTLIDLLPTEDA